jgi:hypothetical protein
MEHLFGCWNRKTNKEWKINLEEKSTLVEGGVNINGRRNKRLISTETHASGGKFRPHARW